MSTEIRRLLDVREEMLTFLRDTDRRDQRHIITAHWLSKLSVLASPVGQEEPPRAWPSESQIEGLKDYVIWHGGAHTHECPGDDTCDCPGKPLNDAVNSILSEAFDRAVSSGHPPVEEQGGRQEDDLSRVDQSALSEPAGSTAREQPKGSQQ